MFSYLQSMIGGAANWLQKSPIEAPDPSTPAQRSGPPYEPSFADVLVVKAMMSKGCGLPNELMDKIVDLAEYWPHTTTRSTGDSPGSDNSAPWWKAIRAGQPKTENEFLLRSTPLGFPPVPKKDREKYALTAIDAVPLQHEYSVEHLQKQTRSPVTLLQNPCRKIVFTIDSHDQGWGMSDAANGPYAGSWTWFSVGKERLEAGTPNSDANSTISVTPENLRTVWPEVVPATDGNPEDETNETGARDDNEFEYTYELHPQEDRKIQANRAVDRKTVQHRVVWSYDDDINPESERAVQELGRQGRGKSTGNGEFVRNLKVGDVVTIWGHSRFGGWVNYVERAKIDVYYAV